MQESDGVPVEIDDISLESEAVPVLIRRSGRSGRDTGRIRYNRRR